MADTCPDPVSPTVLDADQFDALVEDLDVSDDAPALAGAFARPRRFERAAEANPR